MENELKATGIRVRRAKVGDVQQIVSLINFYAEKGEMLYRSQSQVLQQVRNYFVAASDQLDELSHRPPSCASGHQKGSGPSSTNSSVEDFPPATDEPTAHILACGSLDITWNDLAELRSVAVRPDAQGSGIGTSVVKALMDDAVELGLKHVFALTYKPHFFEKLGFKVMDKQLLPHKVWNICIDCLKFPVCDEVAMQIEVEAWSKEETFSDAK
ncbi:MAG: GNAT family N-acetyltransferase [Candidatus Kryptoniota bacterium]